jgi:hypothetical protein
MHHARASQPIVAPFRARALSLVTALVLTLSGPVAAQTSPDDLPPRLDEGVARGLRFLAEQQKEDGSLESGGPRVAMTALGLMAFLSAGHTPDAGAHGEAVRAAIDYLIDAAPKDGYFGKLDGSRMYGHGIATLALVEAAGVEPDAGRRDKMLAIVSAAVKVILDAQDVAKAPHEQGGWRYEPRSADSDLSLSGWNALALRAAQNAGVEVPKERVARAVQYVLKCYHKEQGGFAYQPGQSASIAMTGVALLNLRLLDANTDHPQAAAAVAYLGKSLATENVRYPYYAAYYAAQASFQAGGATWQTVWPPTMDRSLAAQLPDGGWPPSKTNEEPGRVYATAMSVLTLTVPYRLLPIYQR